MFLKVSHYERMMMDKCCRRKTHEYSHCPLVPFTLDNERRYIRSVMNLYICVRVCVCYVRPSVICRCPCTMTAATASASILPA